MYLVNAFNSKLADLTEARNLRGRVGDIEQIVDTNQAMGEFVRDKDSGKPGHYWGRDMMIEGAMPLAAFIVAPEEFSGDTDWWKDDKKFQGYMKNHPEYSWLNK